ncbi:MAG: RsmD family RNA methyltransferase [Candidatus Andersenbacteria bacterium]
MNQQPRQILRELTIEKLVFGGQGLAHCAPASGADSGRTIFVWGALAGETVDAESVRRRGGVTEARAVRVVHASAERVEPREPHYLSCAPWQCLSATAEHDWKIKTAQEAFARIGHLEVSDLELTDAPAAYGYRNKMEFSFADRIGVEGTKQLSLAFFERGTHRRLAIEGCALARPEIAHATTAILAWLRESAASAEQLKSLVVRSDGERVVAGLFVMDRDLPLSLPELKKVGLAGFAVLYSDPRSPISRVDDVLAKVGSLELAQKIAGHTLHYGLESFFQVTVPVFEQALELMRTFIDPRAPLVDLYSGVGSIGISLVHPGQRLTLVENHPEAIAFAKQNIQAAGLLGTTVLAAASEQALHAVTPEATVVVDPPRVGLHAKVAQRLAAVRPKTIVYLSCNVSTQARDLAVLMPHYRIATARLFNFFPRTPHVESLVVLERI